MNSIRQQRPGSINHHDVLDIKTPTLTPAKFRSAVKSSWKYARHTDWREWWRSNQWWVLMIFCFVALFICYLWNRRLQQQQLSHYQRQRRQGQQKHDYVYIEDNNTESDNDDDDDDDVTESINFVDGAFGDDGGCPLGRTQSVFADDVDPLQAQELRTERSKTQVIGFWQSLAASFLGLTSKTTSPQSATKLIASAKPPSTSLIKTNELQQPNNPNNKKRIYKKYESKCRDIMEQLFNLPFPIVRPAFLKYPLTKRNLELDMYNAQLQLAVEYQGLQHTIYMPFLHKDEEDFAKQQRRDQFKRERCRELGITLIEIPYSVRYEQLETYIIQELYRVGKLPPYIVD